MFIGATTLSPQLSCIRAVFDATGKSAIHHAAWRGDIENLKMLLDRGASIEAIATGEFSYGKTPLFFAITRSRDNIVLLLLERGASARIVNNKGQTPLSLGFSHLQDSTLQTLRTHEEAEVSSDCFTFLSLALLASGAFNLSRCSR